MLTKLVERQINGPQAACDQIDTIIQVTVAANTNVIQGQAYSSDCSNFVSVAPALGSFAQLVGSFPPAVSTLYPTALYPLLQQAGAPVGTTTPNIERGVLPTAGTAGPLMGCYQGPTFQNPTAQGSQTYFLQVRMWGYGWALAGSVLTSGVAVNVNKQLFYSAYPTASKAFAISAASNATIQEGLYVGVAAPMTINTFSAAATASGSQTITPNNIAGITTSTPLSIDPGTPVAETVTPASIGAGSNTFTATFANPHAAGFVIQGQSGNANNSTLISANTSGADFSTPIVAFINIS